MTGLGILAPAATAQDLSATMRNDGEWVSRFHPLEFTLTRPLSPGERLELLVGTTDVSDLCTVRGDTLIYQPQVVPLSPGPLSITLSVITPDGAWKPLGAFTLNILTAASLEKMALTPSLSLNNKGQPAEDHFPDGVGGGRGNFQELSGQLALKFEAARGIFQAGLGFNLIGVSFRQEALRFAEKKEDAAKVDLSNYLVDLRAGGAAVSLGHFAHGRERHLLNGFASRGVSAAIVLASFVDLSAAAMSATNIVGWDNLSGLDDPRHRIYSGTLGLEILPAAPGTVRIEASYVRGSQLPISNFNEGQITDAEKSEGGAIRLLIADPGRNITLDAGLAKARFTNPTIPFVTQDLGFVPTEPTTRQARYADISWDILRDGMLLTVLPASLNLTFRHERVDPLYRAVGASARPDILQNTYEMRGGLGPLQANITHLRSEDNLDGIASVLKTFTRQTGTTLNLIPLAQPGAFPSWMPTLSYGRNKTHQFGASTPINSEFTPTRVPAQVTTSQTAAVEWQVSGLRAGYRGTHTVQDNQQVGRENADAVNRIHSLALSLSPFQLMTMSIEGSLESMENLEISSIVRTKRIGLGLSALLFPGASTSFNGTLSSTENDDGSNEQRQASFSVEASYALDLSSSFMFTWRGQLFVRYAWNEAITSNALFDLRQQARAWVITTGVSFNIF